MAIFLHLAFSLIIVSKINLWWLRVIIDLVILGEGAFANGEKIHVSQTDKVSNSSYANDQGDSDCPFASVWRLSKVTYSKLICHTV